MTSKTAAKDIVKGGKDSRKYRQQRRRKRPKVFNRANAATSTDVHDEDASRQNEEVIEAEPYRHIQLYHKKTVSQSKVESIPLPVNELLSGYRLIDIIILSILYKHVRCSICKAVVLLLCQTMD